MLTLVNSHSLNIMRTLTITFLLLTWKSVEGHDAKDLDDSILYRIDFEMPNFDEHPALRNQIHTFYTHEHERYDCVVPVFEEAKKEKELNEPELSPYALLQPIFASPSCSYRIEAYWSYEICHGRHVRQYHEEREGKNVKFQEYYLGTWNQDKTEKLLKSWEEDHKAGIKYKTIKIDNTHYPYFEVQMTDGTMCDIINAPRTTAVRYVCYPHGKNEIYSFKETSSCNYEAIILTSALCLMPAFHPEETKEITIKCFNAATNTHKPLSMLRQELNELQMVEYDLLVTKETNAAAASLARNTATGDRYVFLNKISGEVDKVFMDLMTGSGIEVDTSGVTEASMETRKTTTGSLMDIWSVAEIFLGRECLTGGTGWWKYEFCFNKHVRQFHKDKKSETELYLGFFSEQSHKKWADANPDKGAKRAGYPNSVWHYYGQGTRCDRTGLPREVEVKFTCTPNSNSMSSFSMYLLEPKTCQYILVVESPVICHIYKNSDAYGLVSHEEIKSLLQKKPLNTASLNEEETPAVGNINQRGKNPSLENEEPSNSKKETDDKLHQDEHA